VSVAIHDGWGVRADYVYSRFASMDVEAQYRDPDWLIAVVSLPTSVSGRTQSHAGSVNVVYSRRLGEGRALGYVFGGPSIVHRRATVKAVVTGDLVGFCAPQWFQCAAGAVPVEQATGVRNATDLGVNAGAGVTFDVGLRASLFVEARMLHLFGGEYPQGTTTHRAIAQYVPIVVGLRF